MIETYIVTKKDKIVFSCESQSQEDVLKSLKFMDIKDFDGVQTIPTTNNPRPGTYLDEYKEDWTLKTDYERVKIGRLKLQENQVLNHLKKTIESREPEESRKETDGMSLKEVKAWAKKILSSQCISNNYLEVLPNHKRENIMVGATEGYPDYLCGEQGIRSIKIINQMFQEIHATYSKQIDSANSLTEIQDILDNIQFPTEQDLLKKIKEGL